MGGGRILRASTHRAMRPTLPRQYDAVSDRLPPESLPPRVGREDAHHISVRSHKRFPQYTASDGKAKCERRDQRAMAHRAAAAAPAPFVRTCVPTAPPAAAGHPLAGSARRRLRGALHTNRRHNTSLLIRSPRWVPRCVPPSVAGCHVSGRRTERIRTTAVVRCIGDTSVYADVDLDWEPTVVSAPRPAETRSRTAWATGTARRPACPGLQSGTLVLDG
jgi:hypothetical protein